MEEVTFDKEARDKLIEGINKLNKAVGATMGPSGKTVIIPDSEAREYGKYKVTKDGVSVARSIFFKDPIENIGAQMIKEVAEKTVDTAGDGTTTATVLATAFINNLKDFNTVEINKAFDEIIPKVLEQLKLNSRELKREDIKYVASISANNDIQIGELIQQAFDFSSIIKVEESNNSEDTLTMIDGMSLPVSYFSKHFINNPKKGTCELDEPYVILLDGKLDNLKTFEQAIKFVANENQPLLIITEHVNENVLRLIESNVLSHNLKMCVIKAPGFSKHRKDLLRDLSEFTGAKLVNDFTKPLPATIVGRLKACKIGKNESLLLKHEDINIDQLIDDLKESSLTLEDHDKDLINQRIENLTAKVSLIKVGGGSELEMKERKDRYDDAVKAVACALEEGVVEGGGEALYKARVAVGHKLSKTKLIPEKGHEDMNVDFDHIESIEISRLDNAVLTSLLQPRERIVSNGHVLHRGGFEVGGVRNMFYENVIDPLKVTRCALENAVSVAKTILSTEAVVLNRNEWK